MQNLLLIITSARVKTMTNEIIIAIVSAVAGGVVTFLTTQELDRRKEKREDIFALLSFHR